MIKLVAAQFKSGIAIVFYNQQYLVFKPPYDRLSSCVIGHNDFTQAISKQRFLAEERNFSTFEELFEYMKEKLHKGE